jgi:hypothetical protein
MSFTSWLRNLRTAFAPGRLQRKHRRPRPRRGATRRLHLEALEDRCVPTLSSAVSFGVPGSPQDATFGDFNGDGNLDVATINTSQLSILYGNGAGALGAAQNITLSAYQTSVAAGHFNGDGRLDVAVSSTRWNGSAWEGLVHILLNNGNDAGGNATFQAARTFNTGTNIRPGALAVGDLNGDGKMDVAAANITGSNVTVLLGNGSGDLQTAQQFAVGTSPGSIAVGDFNNDTKLDLVTANRGSGNLSVLLNNGTGTNLGFEAARNSAITGNVQSVAVGDLDANGKLDLIATSNIAVAHPYTYWGYYGYYYGYYYTYEGHVNVLMGDGTGTFASPMATFVGTNELGDLTVGDLNCDGHLDVVTADGVVQVYVDPTVLLGYGNGTFDTPYYFAAGSGPNTVMVAHFNGDDCPDVATANTYSNNVSLLLNDNNWPALGSPFVSISGSTSVLEQNEGTTSLSFTISLAVASEQTVTVDYSTIDGTALAGIDYQVKSGTATFIAGQTSQTIEVQVMGDRIGESNEHFLVTLSNPVNARLGTAQATVTIQDDEPRVSITGATVTEGNTGTKELEFVVSLAVAYDMDVNVAYSTADGSAAAGSDYVAKSGTVTILKGDTSATVKVLISGDRVTESTEYTYTYYDWYYGSYTYTYIEDREYFSVNLTSSDHGNIVSGQATGTIVDDEPRISISGASVTEGNEGTTEATFTVYLSSAYDVDLNISYATADGSAVAGSDYQAKTGTVTILKGDTSGTVKVQVIGDRLGEDYSEYFNVNLLNTNYGAIPSGTTAAGYIYDDEPLLSISDLSTYEGNSGTTYMTFAVTLSTAYDRDITVNFTTRDGSALAGSDYQATSGQLRFIAGDTVEYITVAVYGDTTVEYTESFSVELSGASSYARISDATGWAYIYNDDTSPSPSNPRKGGGKKK